MTSELDDARVAPFFQTPPYAMTDASTKVARAPGVATGTSRVGRFLRRGTAWFDRLAHGPGKHRGPAILRTARRWPACLANIVDSVPRKIGTHPCSGNCFTTVKLLGSQT
jgi:hypothetical protein